MDVCWVGIMSYKNLGWRVEIESAGRTNLCSNSNRRSERKCVWIAYLWRRTCRIAFLRVYDVDLCPQNIFQFWADSRSRLQQSPNEWILAIFDSARCDKHKLLVPQLLSLQPHHESNFHSGSSGWSNSISCGSSPELSATWYDTHVFEKRPSAKKIRCTPSR